MERVTDTTGQLFACGNSLCAFEPKQMCSDCKYQDEANNKLAAYEESGLTPERAVELGEADKDGRLIILPCKPESTVYYIGTKGSCTRCYYAQEKDCHIYRLDCDNDKMTVIETLFNEFWMIDEIGKTIFFTPKEAKAALAVQEGSKNDG